ncbi:glycosyltransferase [Caenispirillum salinarum]|uniref:glycosyltransferase n=1 Tax=Caenispirillum salinarum TaxID=859058 RepID=UPI0038501D4A
METLRVLQAMAGAENGGAELFFERLVTALHRAGVQQHVVLRENGTRTDKLREAGLRPVELPFGGRFDLKTGRGLKKEIARFQPHVVLSWMNRATRFVPKDGPFVKCARLGGYYDLKYYRHCDHLIGNTPDIVDYLVKQGWPEERAHYLPNFVNEEQAAAPASRKANYTPGSVPLVFALGRLHVNKGFDTLLRAIARLPDVYLWIAGDGPERQALDDLAHELGVKPRVRFLGWREDVAALHAAADLFVCPSRHEPLGNVVIEAWAHDRPVVATASQGPSMLIRDGENGLLTPVDEHIPLADAIKRALRDEALRDRLAAAGRADYEAAYTEEKVVAQYRAFFARVVAEKFPEAAE